MTSVPNSKHVGCTTVRLCGFASPISVALYIHVQRGRAKEKQICIHIYIFTISESSYVYIHMSVRQYSSYNPVPRINWGGVSWLLRVFCAAENKGIACGDSATIQSRFSLGLRRHRFGGSYRLWDFFFMIPTSDGIPSLIRQYWRLLIRIYIHTYIHTCIRYITYITLCCSALHSITVH